MTIEPERFPAVNMYMGRIDQAADGLTGIGLVLNALMLSDDYEEPENKILNDMRLTGGLYMCIEALARLISMEVENIKASLEMYERRLKSEDAKVSFQP